MRVTFCNGYVIVKDRNISSIVVKGEFAIIKLQSLQGAGATELHAQIILDSYVRLLGKPLLTLARGEKAADALFASPIVVLSHGVESDPVLNYGNRAAIDLWEMDWDTFTRTPSRLTAEPMVREERQQFLQAVAEKGYIDTYQGIRISSTGCRFRIQEAVVFNLTDHNGHYYGQAAAFAYYSYV
ncbi:MEKHLA domain-containing protein [Paenibacillus spongiae]|uniref:MEKHLA domain-containing protein n=1 Tax=Paenibacillus spongiae TaxID=2909671 RepID=A0ABY5SC81_9BACL|nr:MEKHLA domain-containing protein [Paenibacillus spongiae]UVI31130.1 MEKHLA domain-containing protein [Paenibacillus spongiae]